MNTPLNFLFLYIFISLNSFAKNNYKKDSLSNNINCYFNIKKGVNISHWLSQSNKNEKERITYFSEEDMKLISSIGYDHIRLPIDEKNMWSIKNKKHSLAFQSLHKAIKWAKKYNLKVIVDLHVVRSHFFNNDYNPLWDNLDEQTKFIDLWKQLSEELKGYSNDLVAYEILNEPVANEHKKWNELLALTLKEIRVNEPYRKVIIGSNKWQSVDTFNHLKIPKNDSNIILSFHFYSPHIFTHYKAPWSKKIGFYTGSVKYPGVTVDKKDLVDYNANQIKELKEYTTLYNKSTLLEKLKAPIKIAKQHNLQLYCGEFGCLPTTPNKDRMEWYKDLIHVFEKNNIAWCNWDYQGNFGIKDSETGKLNTELINVLLNKKI
ncbi:cellulase family glycosylhydrolase [Wenyingzhuangia sp. 1_MG-2023]|nr:cellulase family glycosylhydrolase [Wenyingzhuangia sp. 1_MG-2023]